MKKNKVYYYVIIMTLFNLFFTMGTTMAQGQDDPCYGKDVPWLRLHVPLPATEIMEETAVNGLCQIILKIQDEYVPVYAGEDFVLAGEMFKEKNPITQTTLEYYEYLAVRENLDSLKDVVAINYTPENAVGKSVYLVTDPLCPYCNMAGDFVKEVADEYGVSVNLVLMTVHGDSGVTKVREAICKEYDFDEYVESEWKTEESGNITCDEATTLIAATDNVAAKLGLSGVPAFILEDGQVVPVLIKTG